MTTVHKLELSNEQVRRINSELCVLSRKGDKKARALLAKLGGRPPAERRDILEAHADQVSALLPEVLDAGL